MLCNCVPTHLPLEPKATIEIAFPKNLLLQQQILIKNSNGLNIIFMVVDFHGVHYTLNHYMDQTRYIHDEQSFKSLAFHKPQHDTKTRCTQFKL